MSSRKYRYSDDDSDSSVCDKCKKHENNKCNKCDKCNKSEKYRKTEHKNIFEKTGVIFVPYILRDIKEPILIGNKILDSNNYNVKSFLVSGSTSI